MLKQHFESTNRTHCNYCATLNCNSHNYYFKILCSLLSAFLICKIKSWVLVPFWPSTICVHIVIFIDRISALRRYPKLCSVTSKQLPLSFCNCLRILPSKPIISNQERLKMIKYNILWKIMLSTVFSSSLYVLNRFKAKIHK